MRRVILGVVAGLTLALVASTPSSGAVKPGTTCKKAGLTTIESGRKYTCTKQGKKFVWDKGVVIKTAPASVPSPSPKPLTSPVPSITPEPPSDQISHKGVMIYGIDSGMLTRKSYGGTYFSKDSRAASVFSPIRLKAYEELNKNPRNSVHPNVNFIYRISSTFPDFLIEYSKRELDEAAALWNPIFEKKIDVYVDLVTEKDREAIKSNSWLDNNLPSTFTRFDSKRERPFISGGGGYWNSDGAWTGKIFLATASYLDLEYVNYEWPEVAKHEFFHVVQDYSFFKSERNRPQSELEYEKFFPLHFREGGANTIAYLTAFRNIGWSSDALDWLVWQRSENTRTWKFVGNLADAKVLIIATESRKPEEAFEQSYAVGALMYEWVLGTYGLETFMRFMKSYSTTSGFSENVQSILDMDKNSFYDKVAVYVYENSVRVSR